MILGRPKYYLLASFIGILLTFIPHIAAVAVMSVDLGSAWMKVAIVSPGVPMEIVLNRESKRKTPVAISFRDEEREIGDGALSVGVRFPEVTYTHLIDLVGKAIDNPIVQLYQKRFPHLKVIGDPNTNTVLFKKDEETQFSVEELLSMILHRARDEAESFATQTIKDAVITVPPYFNQAERRAVLRAAELADIKVLQLINDNTGVALNYGVFRRKDFNGTMQRILFYDMGAGSTKATIVGYQVVKTKERGFTETNPQLTVLGFGYDRTLGGLEFTLRLRNHLAKVFNEQKKTKTDVFTNPRAMSKLFKESERVKMVLSANNDHYAQVENLLEDHDFRAPISRAEFEELTSDLFELVGGPVERALKQAAMSLDDIDQVILVGASTRIPRVQEKLLEAVKKPELGKNLNTDEAAAMGAVYQAAHLSQGFKVKKFVVKDAVQYPIQVDFEREVDTADFKGTKIVSRTLFGHLSLYPLKKVMTFNRLDKDEFVFNVNYGTLSLNEEDKAIFGSLNISRVQLKGIKDAVDKHSEDGTEAKGVKAHFRMDESGVLNLDLVESVFEKKEEEVEADGDMESTLSKLGSTISKLFSGSGSEEPDSAAQPEGEGQKEGEEKAEKDQKESKPKDEESKPKPEEKVGEKTEVPSDQTTSDNASDTKANATAEDKAQKANETKPLKKPKLVIIKESIGVTLNKLDLKDPNEIQTKQSIRRIEEFNAKEKAQHEKAESKNNLEAFILDTQDKFYQKAYEVASSDDERQKILTKMTEVSDWLYDEGDDAEAEVYRSKLKELKSMSKDIYERVKEHHDRPEALNALKELINMSEVFLTKARSLPEDDQYFTTVELDVLGKAINDTKEWKKKKEAEQAKKPLTETPTLTVRSIAEKLTLLDREVKYLVNKARTSKPKPKKTEPKVNKTESVSNTTEGTAGDETTTPEAPGGTQEAPDIDVASPGEQQGAESNEDPSDDSSNESIDADTPSKPEEKSHTEL